MFPLNVLTRVTTSGFACPLERRVVSEPYRCPTHFSRKMCNIKMRVSRARRNLSSSASATSEAGGKAAELRHKERYMRMSFTSAEWGRVEVGEDEGSRSGQKVGVGVGLGGGINATAERDG